LPADCFQTPTTRPTLADNLFADKTLFLQGPTEITFFKTRYCDIFTPGRFRFPQRLFGFMAFVGHFAGSSRIQAAVKRVAKRVAVSPCAVPLVALIAANLSKQALWDSRSYKDSLVSFGFVICPSCSRISATGRAL
jgi:hypothetical protein